MQAKVLDSSGEAWVSAFNEQAETLLGVSADSLSEMRNQVRVLHTSNLKSLTSVDSAEFSLIILFT